MNMWRINPQLSIWYLEHNLWIFITLKTYPQTVCNAATGCRLSAIALYFQSARVAYSFNQSFVWRGYMYNQRKSLSSKTSLSWSITHGHSNLYSVSPTRLSHPPPLTTPHHHHHDPHTLHPIPQAHDYSHFPQRPVQRYVVFHQFAQLYEWHIDGLVQEKREFRALAMELRLSCTAHR